MKVLRFHLVGLFCLTIVSGVAYGQHYQQQNLVSDLSGMAANTDPNLVNPWGLARSSTGPWWVSDNGMGVSSLYNGAGMPNSLVVAIPGNNGPAAPTGVVFNGSNSFQIAANSPAIFIFVSEDGTISGWNPGVDLTHAVLKVPQKNSVFKGATIATVGGVPYLYVADFHQGRIEVFDTNFQPVQTNAKDNGQGDDQDRERDGDDDGDKNNGAFVDNRLPKGFAPFNVQNIGGNLYVTFAKQDADKHDDVPGAGSGYVDVFTPEGKLIERLEHGDWLNSPWGVTLAPSDFGVFSHSLLVGQFGSGEIAAYNQVTGAFLGKLLDPSGNTITIDGLWSLSFGNSASAGPFNTLFFTAGIQHEAHGLFGTLTTVPGELIEGNGR
jgi:uncharacterized protein (TIGR03118 family)